MSLPGALPGRRERRVESTRQRLFLAAIAEFRSRGFDRASVAQIAREAGVSRPSFYFHFPTKDHVLLELQWQEERAIVARLEGAPSLRAALHALGEGLIDCEARLGDSELFRDMLSIYARRPADLPLDEQPFPTIAALSRHFAEAAARGELRAGLDPGEAARVCMGSVFGLLIGLPGTPDERRADLELLFSLYLAEDES